MRGSTLDPKPAVYVVWDNLNIHYDGAAERWSRFNARLGGRFHFVYTPKHASWMNQVEMATHTGRWQATPFRAQLEEVTVVLESFPWTLAPIE